MRSLLAASLLLSITILARDLPAINLWYCDTEMANNRRLSHLVPTPTGRFSFLETAELQQLN